MIMYVCVIYDKYIHPQVVFHILTLPWLVPLGMAFLLARLQRQVWQAATELQAVPAAAQVEPRERIHW